MMVMVRSEESSEVSSHGGWGCSFPINCYGEEIESEVRGSEMGIYGGILLVPDTDHRR